MIPKNVYLDANLLVLLVVGETDSKLIAKHRRLREFDEEDYESLARLVSHVDQILVTPNTLTEASNLLAYHREPEKSRFFEVLRILIEEHKEIVVASRVASRNTEFTRLGLADAALLEVVSNSNPLITVDLELYLAAARKESESAYNFRHYQSWA